MKNFSRDHLQFSQCGLNCLLCPMHLGGYCPGCGGGEGNQGCSIARCAMERKVGEFCSQCPQFPCAQFEKMMKYDSFLPHGEMVRDLKRAEKLEDYIAKLKERRAILDQLLAGWNDGRRKSFYCLAVYLLELDDLRQAFEEIQGTDSDEKTVKEKALLAVGILNAAAQKRGITLKLNKKPKEK